MSLIELLEHSFIFHVHQPSRWIMRKIDSSCLLRQERPRIIKRLLLAIILYYHKLPSAFVQIITLSSFRLRITKPASGCVLSTKATTWEHVGPALGINAAISRITIGGLRENKCFLQSLVVGATTSLGYNHLIKGRHFESSSHSQPARATRTSAEPARTLIDIVSKYPEPSWA